MPKGIGKREQSKAERRLRIVRAAIDLIRESGSANLSMRMIARRADVSLATPYNLFGSKRAVMFAVLEDMRDFTERFTSLGQVGALERLFHALTLTVDYYVKDPEFYRPLWTALLDLSGKDEGGVALPQNRFNSRVFYVWLIETAQAEGLVRAELRSAVVEEILTQTFNGVMLSLVMGDIEDDDLMAHIGYGYALKLLGLATDAGREQILKKITLYEKMLMKPKKRVAVTAEAIE